MRCVRLWTNPDQVDSIGLTDFNELENDHNEQPSHPMRLDLEVSLTRATLAITVDELRKRWIFLKALGRLCRFLIQRPNEVADIFVVTCPRLLRCPTAQLRIGSQIPPISDPLLPLAQLDENLIQARRNLPTLVVRQLVEMAMNKRH